MRNLIYIFLLLPLLVWSQTIPDKKYHGGVEISKTYHGGVEVWSSTPAGPTELYTRLSAVAAAPNETNVANSGVGFTVSGGVKANWISEAADAGSDSYQASMVNTGSGGGDVLGYIEFTGIPTSTPLLIEIDCRKTGSNSEIDLETGQGWSANTYQNLPTSRGTLTFSGYTSSVSNPKITIYDATNVASEKAIIYEIRVTVL